jgi:hypothetical protein
MARAPAWILCCSLVAADGLLGCGTSCDKENEEARDYSAGLTSSGCSTYQTNAFDEKYLDFPAGRRWRIAHGLGQTPTLVQSYLAFTDAPLTQGENGNTAESAGNQVIIERVDDQFVQVRNDTCEHFYLRLVIAADAPSLACLAAGGGGDGGAAGSGG